MTNKIIAQSSRFRAVRTSRDRVRIKTENGKFEFGSLTRDCVNSKWLHAFTPANTCQDLLTFVEAVRRTLEKEGK